MATGPKSGAENLAGAAKAEINRAAKSAEATAARAGTRRSAEELEADIAKLREDISLLTRHLKETGRDSMRGARRAAEDLKAQGEAAMEDMRARSSDMQAQVEDKVREKPITSLAIAAAVGYMLAILTRR